MTFTINADLVNSGFENLPQSPMLLFQQWLAQAHEIKLREPRSIVLATVDQRHHPSSQP